MSGNFKQTMIIVAIGLFVLWAIFRQGDSAAGKFSEKEVAEMVSLAKVGPGDVLVDFSATWCGPCKTQMSILDTLAAKTPELSIIKIDVDENPDAARGFRVRSIPALFAFRNGKLVGTSLGVTSVEKIRAMFP